MVVLQYAGVFNPFCGARNTISCSKLPALTVAERRTFPLNPACRFLSSFSPQRMSQHQQLDNFQGTSCSSRNTPVWSILPPLPRFEDQKLRHLDITLLTNP